MARVGSINYQVAKIIKTVNGIGQSKADSRDSSSITSFENGHKISDKVHSYKSLDNLRSELKDLGKFAKEKHGIKDMSKITSVIVKDWISEKNIKYDTATNYISNLNKISHTMSFSREEMKVLREEMKVLREKSQQKTRYYKLDQVTVPGRSQPAFELQRDYGLRVSAATHININKQIDGNILKYQEKGGKWSEKELTPALVAKIKENAVSGKYDINYRTYGRDLQKAIEKTGQIYNGTHGIRHSYAQNKLLAGATKAEVSQEMGHQREEITNVYLR